MSDTSGDKTEVEALALRRLLERKARSVSRFGAHRGGVRIRESADLMAPALDTEPDAETGRELKR